MPLLGSRKRRATVFNNPPNRRRYLLTSSQQVESEPATPSEQDEASPAPATQRRRLSPEVEDEPYGSNDEGAQSSSLEQMVKKMVRLALACEYQRRPIRRAEIGEKVLGSGARQFKSVFEATQVELRTVFGMEMVELPAREKVTLQQKRAAQKQSQANKTAASWVLVSILPTEFHDPRILHPPLAPTSSEDSKYTAIYTVLVALIRLSGDALPDAKMERYLRRVHMEDHTPVTAYEKTANLLKRLEKDGYIVKIREAAGQDEDIYWTIGPRGRVEIGDAGVMGLVRAVYDPDNEGTQEELEKKLSRSLGLGERPPERQSAKGSGEGKKKRGRRRRDEIEEGEREEERGESSDEE